jgi:DNA-binding transcriptional MocR family regulator
MPYSAEVAADREGRGNWRSARDVHKTTITRDYEQWTALGFVKRRPNPFKASAARLIFSWSPVWDDQVWTDHERVASLRPELRHFEKKSCTDATLK